MQDNFGRQDLKPGMMSFKGQKSRKTMSGCEAESYLYRRKCKQMLKFNEFLDKVSDDFYLMKIEI